MSDLYGTTTTEAWTEDQIAVLEPCKLEIHTPTLMVSLAGNSPEADDSGGAK